MPIAAFLQGIFGASSLILGASIALVWPPKKTVSAAVMAFGSGILISAIAFEITLKVHHESGFLPLPIGFILGGGKNPLSSCTLNVISKAIADISIPLPNAITAAETLFEGGQIKAIEAPRIKLEAPNIPWKNAAIGIGYW